MKKDNINSLPFEKAATRVTGIGIIGNIFLSLLKAVAGIISHSGALISDAVHSAADVFSNIVVMIGVRLSAKKPDREHPYGHERFECVAAAILAIILLTTGIFIGKSAIDEIVKNNYAASSFDFFAIFAAIISILTKEFLFRLTKVYGLKYNSQALLADALHHRSDVLATLGALVGIVGASLGFPVFDSVASLAICVLILKTAYGILRESAEKMIDRSCDEEMQNEIISVIKGCDGVLGLSSLRTRLFGNKIYAEAQIFVDSEISVKESALLSTALCEKVKLKLSQIKDILIIPVPNRQSDTPASKFNEQ